MPIVGIVGGIGRGLILQGTGTGINNFKINFMQKAQEIDTSNVFGSPKSTVAVSGVGFSHKHLAAKSLVETATETVEPGIPDEIQHTNNVTLGGATSEEK